MTDPADALPWAVVTCGECVRPFRVAPEQAATWTRCHGCDMHATGYRQGREDGEQRGADRMARAMVAALYWRAGEAIEWHADVVSAGCSADSILRSAHYGSDALELAAHMEALGHARALEARVPRG